MAFDGPDLDDDQLAAELGVPEHMALTLVESPDRQQQRLRMQKRRNNDDSTAYSIEALAVALAERSVRREDGSMMTASYEPATLKAPSSDPTMGLDWTMETGGLTTAGGAVREKGANRKGDPRRGGGHKRAGGKKKANHSLMSPAPPPERIIVPASIAAQVLSLRPKPHWQATLEKQQQQQQQQSVSRPPPVVVPLGHPKHPSAVPPPTAGNAFASPLARPGAPGPMTPQFNPNAPGVGSSFQDSQQPGSPILPRVECPSVALPTPTPLGLPVVPPHQTKAGHKGAWTATDVANKFPPLGDAHVVSVPDDGFTADPAAPSISTGTGGRQTASDGSPPLWEATSRSTPALNGAGDSSSSPNDDRSRHNRQSPNTTLPRQVLPSVHTNARIQHHLPTHGPMPGSERSQQQQPSEGQQPQSFQQQQLLVAPPHSARSHRRSSLMVLSDGHVAESGPMAIEALKTQQKQHTATPRTTRQPNGGNAASNAFHRDLLAWYRTESLMLREA